MRGVLFLVLVGASACVRADETLYVQVPAELAADAPIAEAVLAECNIESTVGNYVYAGVKRRHPAAQIARRAGDGTELRLTILAVRGVGPGPYTQKSIDLRADLVRGKKLVDSNVFHRALGGSTFGRIRGACDVFARVATVLGRDVSAWLTDAVARATAPNAPSASPVVQQPPPESVAVETLEELQKLREEGMITGKEYEQMRARILKGL